MKKRFLALFLCCVMVFTLLPAALTTAFATGEPDEEQPACTCGATEDAAHAEDCPLYVNPEQQPDDEQPAPDEQQPVCTCGAAEGAAHAEDCPLYVNPEQPDEDEKQDEQPVACTCGAAEGAAHAEDCPLYVAPEQPTDEQDKQDEQPVACTCGAAEGAAHAEDCPLYVAPEQPTDEQQPEEEQEQPDAFQTLYDKLMATSSLEEFAEICDACEEGELAQFEKWAEENDLLDALRGHISDITPEYEVPETVVFTDAGPFLPAVLVPTAGRPLRAPARGTTNGGGNTDGLILSKAATVNPDGSYKIRLEAHTTGTVTTSTTTVPMDVVLVLDQSGSMQYDFNGNTTNDNTKRRQYALKNAVNGFIDAVAEKYSDTADHRMAIVKFSDQATLVQGWTSVNSGGAQTLHNKINTLPTPRNGTHTDLGMAEAVTLMKSGYNYAGTNTTRQKVVILFTDGVPGDYGFDESIANKAIGSAKTLKDDGATVYAIGIFTGAVPSQLYGKEWVYRQYSNITCSGEVGSYWGGYRADYETPAANRYMNFISSNFPGAEDLGAEEGKYDPGNHWAGEYGFKITKNFDRAAETYYLTASNADSLKTIFTNISNNIQNASIDLGAQTQIRDIVSPYFTVPANTSDIKLYTAAYQGNGSWAAPVAATATSGPNATITGKTVSVTGFDFNANFISENPKTDGTRGSKLIIEFTVNPEPGFLGGNGVPTNGSDSGVYDKDGNEVKKFDVPPVNVPIQDVTVTAQDKNVYLLGTVTEDQLKDGASAMCNGVNLLNTSEYTGANAWKADYVEITTTVTPNGSTNLTADTPYTISVTVGPKPDSTPSAEGTPAEPKTGTANQKINVFKPELTFKDTEAYYGDTVPANLEGNRTKTEWKHGETVADPAAMLGTAPELTITCAPDGNKILNGKIDTTDDIGVKATVKIGDRDVTGYTKFHHQECIPKQNCTLPANSEFHFLIHVKTCTLTVKKELAAGTAIDDGQSFIFNVTGPMGTKRVVIQGAGSVTLKGLKVGEYTVTEDTAWSWRYRTDNGTQSATLSAVHHDGSVTVTNTLENEKWVSTDVYCKNEFKDSGTKTIINGSGKTVNGNPVNN